MCGERISRPPQTSVNEQQSMMNELDTITVYKTKPRGGSVGEAFCDAFLIGDIETAAIRQITTWGLNCIYGLEVKYTWEGQLEATGVKRGSQDRTVTVLSLKDDEFVTGVEGYSDGNCIYQLTFITNHRRSPPHGDVTLDEPSWLFRWGEISTGQGTQITGMRLLAFSGRTVQGHLRTLQGIFLDSRESNIHTVPGIRSTANYEGINVTSKSGETGVLTVPFSKFTSHLIAPAISLFIGPNRLELHAHEDTLCKLPFFEAALTGSVYEPVTRIDMPEDAPRMVSGLIEYLYTGNYTYPYNSGSAQLHKELGTPLATLTEGQYHVGIVGIASKYDCQELVTMAARNFEAVLLELDSIDTLQLWTTAYRAGPDLDVLTKGFERCHPGNAVRLWVKDLFKKHREAIDKTIVEFPEFASELLRLTASGDD